MAVAGPGVFATVAHMGWSLSLVATCGTDPA